MSDKARSGSGDGGAEKTAHRFPWLTGEYVAKQVLTFVMAAIGALLGASYMIGVQFTALNNRISANAAGVKSARADVTLLATDVGQLKKDLAKQTNTLRGVFSAQYGHLKDKVDDSFDKVDKRFDKLEKMAERADERMRWLQEEQRKEMRRAPAWQRDEWLREKKP